MNTSEYMLNQHYGCSNMSTSCSDFEFAAIQWGSSNITLNLPASIQSTFPVNSTTSVATIYPYLFSAPFEYYAIAKYLSPNYPHLTVQPLNYSTILPYLTSISLFSAPIVQSAIVLNYAQDFTNFTKNFGEMDPLVLLSYFRFLIIEHAFNGITQSRSGQELLYGYTDPLVDKIGKMYVPDGGNPSVNPVIALGGQNSTAEDARKYYAVTVYTGADDPNKVKVYKSTANKTFINYNCTYFDGMEVKQEWKSAWKKEVPIAGTDSTLNPGNITDGKNLTFFVSDVFFVSSRTLSDLENRTKTIYGLKTYQLSIEPEMMANKTNNPLNDQYYLEKYNMALNLTKAKNMPAFVTKQYFLDADQEMIDAVELYADENMTQKISPNKSLDVAMYLEPTTGASLAADQRLQINVLFEPDELFPNVKTSFVPVMYFYRGFQFSEETVDKLFGKLKIGFAVRDSIFVSLLITSILMNILTLFCARVWRKNVAEEKVAEYVGSDDPGALLIGNKRSAKNDESVTMI